MKRNTKVIIGAVAGAALALTAGGIAHAAIPSADASFTACVLKAGGATRIIDTDAGQTCQTTETKVSWGGGMRYRGVWTTRFPWPGSGYPEVRKGDVIYYNGPSNAFGCSSPSGSYVSVAGSYAYPCLEFPQNWAPLALDGAKGTPGKNSDVHWVTLDAQGKMVSSSEAGVEVYASPGSYHFVRFPNLDPTKCALQASVSDAGTGFTGYSGPATTTYADAYAGYILAGGRKADGHPSDTADERLLPPASTTDLDLDRRGSEQSGSGPSRTFPGEAS